MEPIKPRPITRRGPHERDGASREEILLLALRNALTGRQTQLQRIVVRQLIKAAYREIYLDF
jgi:hypothetical protein